MNYVINSPQYFVTSHVIPRIRITCECSNFNVASIGILRTINNSIKPWIYINFRSEELMQAAIEISPTLNGRQLIWEQPDNVRNFCSRCSNPEHKAKDCDNIRSRGRKPTPKALLDTYRKHDIVNAATK